jgi:hypothetical protein
MIKYLLLWGVIIFNSCVFIGCSICLTKQIPAQNEIVMKEGMKITAINKYGAITITAGKGLKRSYTWEGETRTLTMIPRKERWDGSLGLYNPGDWRWKENAGITRAVVEEGQLHFNTQEELQSYISRYSEKDEIVYNDNGLFVSWGPTDGGGGTLSVLLWQFYIQGKKPEKLPGSKNDKIIVENIEY